MTDAGTLLITVIVVIIRLINLGCLLYIVYRMFQEKGIFHALLGFLCCQLYPFIWGWLNSNSLRVLDLMVFWTFITLLEVVMAVVLAFVAPEVFSAIWGGVTGFEGGF